MRKPLLALALATSATLLLASCAMPADDPNFGKVTSGASGAAGGGTADEMVAAASMAPTTIGIDVPLAAAPTAGALIIGLSDGTEGSVLLNDSMAAAAEALGWTFEVIEGADTSDGAMAAFDEAVAKKPAGIHINGAFVDYLTDGLAAATAAGIPVVCTECMVDPLDALKDTSIVGRTEVESWGGLIGAFVQVNNANEDAVIEMVALGTPAPTQFDQGLQASMMAYCEPCSTNENFLDPLDPTMLPLDVATLALQLNPTATWLSYAPGSLSVDAQEAITAAAMPEAAVRVVGMGASPANLAALQDGTAAAFTGYPIPLVGWRVIDQFARILGGEEPIVAMLPLQLLTAESVSSAALDADGNFIAVADYVDQFKTLWGVK
jgi:ribose transport system substrate-binding protein